MTSPAVGRRLRARYAFAGAAEELARTLPLEDGEPVLLSGGVRLVPWRSEDGDEVLRLASGGGRALARPLGAEAVAAALKGWLSS